MPDDVITDIAQIIMDWLNAVLVQSGALVVGSVRNFHVEASTSDNAHMIRIHVHYSPDAVGKRPECLWLKMCSGGHGFIGQSEVHYYDRDYVRLTDAPLPTCYHARYSRDTGAYHILMEDLSESHRNNWRQRPTRAYGRAVAEALATMHAHWWGAARLHSIESAIPGQTDLERYMVHIQRGLGPLLEATQADIDASWTQALVDIFTYHPAKMLERTKKDAGFTVVHGDVNPGNILSPREGRGKTYVIDRQPFAWSLPTWLGVSDLAYLMVPWWETDVRRQFEYSMLRAYHKHLVRCGITDYEWEQLLYDYRLTAVQGVYVATEWCVLAEDCDRMRWVWFPQLQKSMRAFFDLKCSELWTQ
jgi:hypothetical protein